MDVHAILPEHYFNKERAACDMFVQQRTAAAVVNPYSSPLMSEYTGGVFSPPLTASGIGAKVSLDKGKRVMTPGMDDGTGSEINIVRLEEPGLGIRAAHTSYTEAIRRKFSAPLARISTEVKRSDFLLPSTSRLSLSRTESLQVNPPSSSEKLALLGHKQPKAPTLQPIGSERVLMKAPTSFVLSDGQSVASDASQMHRTKSFTGTVYSMDVAVDASDFPLKKTLSPPPARPGTQSKLRRKWSANSSGVDIQEAGLEGTTTGDGALREGAGQTVSFQTINQSRKEKMKPPVTANGREKLEPQRLQNIANVTVIEGLDGVSESFLSCLTQVSY